MISCCLPLFPISRFFICYLPVDYSHKMEASIGSCLSSSWECLFACSWVSLVHNTHATQRLLSPTSCHLSCPQALTPLHLSTSTDSMRKHWILCFHRHRWFEKLTRRKITLPMCPYYVLSTAVHFFPGFHESSFYHYSSVQREYLSHSLRFGLLPANSFGILSSEGKFISHVVLKDCLTRYRTWRTNCFFFASMVSRDEKPSIREIDVLP